jgi:hypothetical protein
MNNRQEYEAHLENWLENWGKKIQTVESETAHPFQAKLDDMKIVHQDIRGKLDEMKQSDDSHWEHMRARVDKIMGHIDTSFRESLAYFH